MMLKKWTFPNRDRVIGYGRFKVIFSFYVLLFVTSSHPFDFFSQIFHERISEKNRVTKKEWDLRDDCSELKLSISYIHHSMQLNFISATKSLNEPFKDHIKDEKFNFNLRL